MARAKPARIDPGTCFAVPLAPTRWILGVVARRVPWGALGYFFADRASKTPVMAALAPRDATRILFVSDMAIRSGEWPTMGMVPHWNAREWPVPVFARREPGPRGRAWLVHRADDDPSVVEGEAPDDGSTVYESDGLYGSKAAEVELRLRPNMPDRPPVLIARGR